MHPCQCSAEANRADSGHHLAATSKTEVWGVSKTGKSFYARARAFYIDTKSGASWPGISVERV